MNEKPQPTKEKLVKMAAQFFENNKEEWSLIFWGA